MKSKKPMKLSTIIRNSIYEYLWDGESERLFRGKCSRYINLCTCIHLHLRDLHKAGKISLEEFNLHTSTFEELIKEAMRVNDIIGPNLITAKGDWRNAQNIRFMFAEFLYHYLKGEGL